MGRKESKHPIFLEIIALIILIVIALKLKIVAMNSSGYDAIFKVPLFVLPILAIGYIIWDLFGDQISAPLASLFLWSGEKIARPKYYSKAHALIAQNKIEEAIKIYEKIITEDKSDITAYCELADIYHEKLKDYSAAFDCYEKIEQYAQETTDIIFAINRKVDIHLLNKDYAKAVNELEKIIKRFPKIKDAARAEERIKNIRNKIV